MAPQDMSSLGEGVVFKLVKKETKRKRWKIVLPIPTSWVQGSANWAIGSILKQYEKIVNFNYTYFCNYVNCYQFVSEQKGGARIVFILSNHLKNSHTCLFLCAMRSFRTFSSCKMSRNRIISWSVQFGLRFLLSENPNPRSGVTGIMGAK